MIKHVKIQYVPFQFQQLANVQIFLVCCAALLAYFCVLLCCKNTARFAVFQRSCHYFEFNLLMFIATKTPPPVEHPDVFV